MVCLGGVKGLSSMKISKVIKKQGIDRNSQIRERMKVKPQITARGTAEVRRPEGRNGGSGLRAGCLQNVSAQQLW